MQTTAGSACVHGKHLSTYSHAKCYQSAWSLMGEEDPGAITSGVRQRRIILQRLCGVSLSASPSPVSSRCGQADVPCRVAGRACLLVWVCARACVGLSNSIGPRQEIRAAVLACSTVGVKEMQSEGAWTGKDGKGESWVRKATRCFPTEKCLLP